MRIEKIDMDGNGIVYYNDKITFVKKAILLDDVDIEIIEEHKKYNIAKIKKINTKSPYRINTDCIYYDECGGCSYRHTTYLYESLVKEKKVENLLKEFNIQDKEHIKANNIYNYRNKVVNPINKETLELGMYMENTHNITSICECKIAPSNYKEIANAIKEWLKLKNYTIRDDSNNGFLRNVMIRINKCNEVLLVLVVSKYKDIDIEYLKNIKNIKEIYLNINDTKHNVIMGKVNHLIYQKDKFYDYLFDLKFKIYPNTFLQVNREQTEVLYEIIKDFLEIKEDDNILDCYCGIGTITLYIAKYVKNIVGVEVVEESIDSANYNKVINNIRNATFVLGKVEEVVDKLNKKFNKVIVDPPRKGLDKKVLNYLNNKKFERIVYVSCNPATLKRDLLDLKESYEIIKYKTIDLFPRTKHVESVVLLSKVKK